nr:hypothetical protein [uncultured Flavobacterium sp.]
MGFIICTISFYFIVFGLPVFLIGAVLVFNSRARTRTKIITTILPILLWLPATFAFLYFYGRKTPETYLIPVSVDRYFRVVYNEKCGIEPKYERGRRIFEIPKSGILIVKSKFESGWLNHEYYLVDDKGNRLRVDGSNFDYKKPEKIPSVSFRGTGLMSLDTYGQSLNVRYSDFFINSDSSLISTDYKEMESFDSLTIFLIESCRFKAGSR